jgi:hypothetical protein
VYVQEKLAYDAEHLLYFRHAPPILERQVDLSAYPAKRPQPPYKGAKGWHCSVYYFWWAFLKENADFRSGRYNGTDTKEGHVARHFREVGTMNFPNWWLMAGRFLFAEPQGEGIRLEVPPVDPGALSDRVLLSVPFNGDIDRTLSELRSVLSAAFEEQRLNAGPSRARYPVLLTTPLHTLYRRYQVWCARRDNPDLPLHEVGLIAGLLPSGPVEDFDVRRSFASTVSRYYKEAKCIIEHVGRGLFPVMNPKQLGSTLGEPGTDVEAEHEDASNAGIGPEEMAAWIDRVYHNDPERAARYRAELLPRLQHGLNS